MLPKSGDTIAAIATAKGVGGVGIVRISGSLVTSIAKKIIKQTTQDFKLTPNKAVYASFLSSDHQDHFGNHQDNFDNHQDNKDLNVIDSGIAIYFKSPNSFTGEDVLELQAHGGQVILDLLLRQVLNLGARIAEPGEFSKRAFLNGKIDLVQAESIVDLINAQTEQAAIAASKSLQGEFSKQIDQLLRSLIDLRIHIEAAIDFPEDQIDLLEIDQINSKLNKFKIAINIILEQAKQGNLLKNGIKIVILGKPNVGKSSLLNLLSGEDRAIVTEVPGTTRDVIINKVNLDGLLIDFSDTAGIRETNDLVEKIGIQKAIKEAELADLILLMVDPEEFLANPNLGLDNLLPKELINQNKKVIIVINKIDLININEHCLPTSLQSGGNSNRAAIQIVCISVKEKLGINLLIQQIKETVNFNKNLQIFSAKTRHIAALKKVNEHIENGIKIFFNSQQYWELLAEELRSAQEYLSQITGVFTNEDLLNKIFAEFCIGK